MNKIDIDLVKKIKDLDANGINLGEIAKRLEMSYNQVRYYARLFDLDYYTEKLAKKDEEEKYICELIKNSNNINQVCSKLGIVGTNSNYKKIYSIIEKYKIDTSHFCVITNMTHSNSKRDLNDILRENTSYPSSKLWKRLIKEGLKEKKCECCGLTEWQGKEIPLELHHINGNHNDNRIENLQLLCPNCHAQTDNFCKANGVKLPKKRNLKKYICKYCGKEFEAPIKQTFCCREHYEQYMRENKIYNAETSKCPSKEVLLQDFAELHNFAQVGKKYGVAGNTIRKWCKKMNLPIYTKDIQEYIK